MKSWFTPPGGEAQHSKFLTVEWLTLAKHKRFLYMAPRFMSEDFFKGLALRGFSKNNFG